MPAPVITPDAYKYAEAVLVRDVEFQGTVASYLSNGALAALAALIAAFSLLYGVASQHGAVPNTAPIFAAIVLVFGGGAVLVLAWSKATVKAGPDPIQVATDLVVTGLPALDFRKRVIAALVRTHGLNRIDLGRARNLLAAAVPIAAAGLWLFIYGIGT